jgi:DNA polymerase-1
MKSKQPSRTVIVNIEANGLKPDTIWAITCKDIDTGEVREWTYPIGEDFNEYWSAVTACIGHNLIGYDLPALVRLCKISVPDRVIDTLVVSRLLDYSRDGGHSLRAWALSLGITKHEQPPFDWNNPDLRWYCTENVQVTHEVYKTLLPWINSPRWKAPIETEHEVSFILREMHDNGFYLDIDKVRKLRYNILEELETLDEQIAEAFHPKVVPVRTVTPRLTKFGTLNRSDFRWVSDGDLSPFNGGPFTLIRFEEFNPGSPSQIVERLNEAGWKPYEKTKGHITAEREKDKEKLAKFRETGWAVSENNLATLPDTAPAAARSLALRITLASRVRTLTEWVQHYNEDTRRVHGTVNGLGAWTGRCSHTNPNTGNIPTPQPLDETSTYLKRRAHEIDSQLRTYWGAFPGSYLVGVDAEGIQLRVLAHYMNDPRFTFAVTSGNKDDGTDPHTLNKIALGSPCKSRADAKTFIYAWLLGAGVGKVGQILGCSGGEAKKACEDFITFYPGLVELKRDHIPNDASRGYFEGFDGRYVSIVGEDQGSREHFALAGYLQNGEVIVMKRAMQIWYPRLIKERIPFELVNFVHDEWQTQVNAGRDVAEYVASVQKDAIRQAGEDLNLRCPMSGSSDIGFNWKETH